MTAIAPAALIPSQLHDDPATAQAFEAGIRGQSLLVFGVVGSGKTTLLARIAAELERQNPPPRIVRNAPFVSFEARMYFVPTLLDSLMAAAKRNEPTDKSASLCRWLFLDDLGIEQSSEWSVGILSELIDHRVRNNLPFWISANLTVGELRNQYGERLASRILSTCKVIQLRGHDRRFDHE